MGPPRPAACGGASRYQSVIDRVIEVPLLRALRRTHMMRSGTPPCPPRGKHSGGFGSLPPL
eukprot:6244978-Prymnesium_polylepis.2